MTYRNAGRKPKYNEPTTTIAFRVPKSKATEVKNIVNEQLKKYELAALEHNKTQL